MTTDPTHVPPLTHDVDSLTHPDIRVDGPAVRCSFETWWCRGRAFQCGGGDVHHEWPRSMGGPDEATDTQHLLNLCPDHHRRQHALIRAYVEFLLYLPAPPAPDAVSREDALQLLPHVEFVRPFSRTERNAALYAVTQWDAASRPAIGGWSCDAAVVKRYPDALVLFAP